MMAIPLAARRNTIFLGLESAAIERRRSRELRRCPRWVDTVEKLIV
jgi:hypothetical protein